MTKINKTRARKEFNQGKNISLMPCKTAIGGVLEPHIIDNNDHIDFDRMVNNFEYYNCNYEVGRYTHFYINLDLDIAKTLSESPAETYIEVGTKLSFIYLSRSGTLKMYRLGISTLAWSEPIDLRDIQSIVRALGILQGKR